MSLGTRIGISAVAMAVALLAAVGATSNAGAPSPKQPSLPDPAYGGGTLVGSARDSSISPAALGNGSMSFADDAIRASADPKYSGKWIGYVRGTDGKLHFDRAVDEPGP